MTHVSRRVFLAGAAAVASAASPRAADPGDRIRKLVMLSAPQATIRRNSRPRSFSPRPGGSWGWRSRFAPCPARSSPTSCGTSATSGTCRCGAWSAGPERSDPDELVYTCSIRPPRTAATTSSPTSTRTTTASRSPSARRLDPREAPAVHVPGAGHHRSTTSPTSSWSIPKNAFAYSSKVWKPEIDGRAERHRHPLLLDVRPRRARERAEGHDRNAAEPLVALNPLYIGGAVDSWMTELVWDRLMRVGPDGLPMPWSASKAAMDRRHHARSRAAPRSDVARRQDGDHR